MPQDIIMKERMAVGKEIKNHLLSSGIMQEPTTVLLSQTYSMASKLT